jgi:DNA-binding NtrC family response regulator
VRELEHAVERAVLLCTGTRIQAEDLGLRRKTDGREPLEHMTLEEADRLLVSKALSRTEGNVSRAAEELGISRGALYRRMEQYGL